MNEKSFRPVPFYFITTDFPENFTLPSAMRQMTALRDAGFGGCVFFNKPPSGFNQEEFLGEPWFEAVRNFAEASRRLDLELWINDGFDFPPGDAGGRIQKMAPDLCQRRIVLNEDGDVEVKEVEWGFPAFEEPESSRLFIELVYESHLKHAGEYFGNGITGFFSDADARRINCYVFSPDSPQRDYFPWSKDFSAAFLRQNGYEIEPYLKDILKRKKCSATADYWRMCGKLYARWFANNHAWCSAYGLKYTFHSSDTGPLPLSVCQRSSIYAEGKPFDILRNSDYPGTDHELLSIDSGRHFFSGFYMPRVSWGGDASEIRAPDFLDVKGDLRAKIASSAAFNFGRKGAMSEMFAATSWGAAPSDLREIAAWQVMQGINFIVPHAVHQSLKSGTKFFAPPDFSMASSLGWSMREMNDELEKYCRLASMGELIAPLALLDTTEAVWRGESDSAEFVELCAELNRRPQGYVIADFETIKAAPGRFMAVVNPGLKLSAAELKLLENFKLPVLTLPEMSRLDELVPCKVNYCGEGRPHIMRRRLDNGSEMTVLANIEDGKLISGELSAGDEKYQLELYPGEIAFFSHGFTDYRRPARFRKESERIELQLEHDVEWKSPNILPIVRWIGENGNICCIGDGGEGKFCFEWETFAGVGETSLFVPALWKRSLKQIVLDGLVLKDAKKIKVFDDDYFEYRLNIGTRPGKHILAFEKEEASKITDKVFGWTERAFLSGDFNVEIETSNPFYRKYASQYNLSYYIPEMAKVGLSARSQSLLTNRSWTEQGHPFYSGIAEYQTSLSIPDSWNAPHLLFPAVGNVCELKVNGNCSGKRLWNPYGFDLSGYKGECRLQITVNNTLANALELYRAPSGILEPGFCYNA